MNEKQIEDIKNSLREVIQLLTKRGEPLSKQLKVLLTQAMEHAATRITELRQQDIERSETGIESTIEPEMPQESPNVQSLNGAPPNAMAQLLWILGGQNIDAFVKYLENFPDPQAQALLRNPQELDRVIKYLHRIMPPGEQPSLDSIPHADINSSNIYGFRYDPKSGNLKVRFQSGAVYGYQGVPPAIFNVFKNGAVPAKTTGQNRFGRWWTGKMPSLGAAFYQMIREGGYPYQKLSG